MVKTWCGLEKIDGRNFKRKTVKLYLYEYGPNPPRPKIVTGKVLEMHTAVNIRDENSIKILTKNGEEKHYPDAKYYPVIRGVKDPKTGGWVDIHLW